MLANDVVSEYMPSKDAIQAMGDFFASCGHESRMRIISLLCLSALSVGEIATTLRMNQTTVSHQLRILRDRKIVYNEQTGKTVVYHIANSELEKVLSSVINITGTEAEKFLSILKKKTV